MKKGYAYYQSDNENRQQRMEVHQQTFGHLSPFLIQKMSYDSYNYKTDRELS